MNNDLITFEEFQSNPTKLPREPYAKTNIACPVCGNAMHANPSFTAKVEDIHVLVCLGGKVQCPSIEVTDVINYGE